MTLVITSLSAAADVRWTLEAAIEQALKNSHTASQAKSNELIAEIEASITDSSDKPRIELTSNFRSSTASINEPYNIDRRQRDAVSLGTQLSYDLYDFGRHSAQNDIAKQKQKNTKIASRKVRDSIIYNVVRAYYIVQDKERIAQVAKNQLKLSIDEQSHIKQRYQQGLRSQSDFVIAELDVENNKLTYEYAKTQLEIAKQNLLQLIHSGNQRTPPTIDSEFSITEALPLSDPEGWDQSIALIFNYSQSTTEEELRGDLNLLAYERSALNSQLYPILTGSIGIAISNSREKNLTPDQRSAFGQLSLNWQLPWNGINRLEQEKTNEKQNIIESRLSELKSHQETIKRKTLILVQSAKAQHSHLMNKNDLAKKQQKLVHESYLAGKSSALEMSAADSNLLNSTIEIIKLHSSVIEALLDLCESQGIRDINVLSKL